MSQSSAIAEFGNTLLLGTVIATEECAAFLKAVTDNADPAYRTGRCKRMDRALETVIGVDLSFLGHLESLVIVVAASFTFCHVITAEGFVA
jgi:hypothetical protein